MDIFYHVWYWARHVEPVAVTTLVAAVFALSVSIQVGNVDAGVINAVVIAVLGLIARSQVSPVVPPHYEDEESTVEE